MSDISLLNKIQEYNENHCYQYQKRLDTLEEDKKVLGFTDDDIVNIRVEDFELKYIDSKDQKQESTDFIKRDEWLGTLG
jgi:hypothetical protein